MKRNSLVCAGVIAAVAVLSACGGSTDAVQSSTPNASVNAGGSDDPIIAAVGDISCDPTNPDFNSGNGQYNATEKQWHCVQKKTAETAAGLSPAAVLTLGDNQYARGTEEQFLGSFNLPGSWGQFLNTADREKSLIHPTPGNHEYYNGKVTDADPYFNYFNGGTSKDPAPSGPAGNYREGWYSFNLGSWHIISLNGECKALYGSATLCGPNTPEMTWLANDLAANKASGATKCTLAYWHRPLFTTGKDEPTEWVKPFWDQLYAYHADVILNGHNHSYERYAKQNPDGQADPNGIAQWVVGTGGNNLYKDLHNPEGNLLASQNTSYGVEKLTLHADSYDFDFAPVATDNPQYHDPGTATCNAK